MGNIGNATRTVHVLDNVKPVITFSPNQNQNHSKRHDVAIKVVDIGGVDNDSLKYIWTTSSSEPSLSEFVLEYNPNELVSSPLNFTGTYYLWAMAKDKAGNLAIKGSGGFELDSVLPVITLNGSNTINIEKAHLIQI